MRGEQSDIEKSFASYTKWNLRFYDGWMLGTGSRLFWDCPLDFIKSHYRGLVSDNHLDAGVGTGYFLEDTLPEGEPKLALLDANHACLEFASRRLERYRPELYEDNLMEPMDLYGSKYDSISLNFVLHCLPGRLEDKGATVFEHLIPHLEAGGVIFGSSILGTDVNRSLPAKLVMRFYNQRGVFSNREDSLGGMMEALSSKFKTFNVEVHGCVVLFWGRSPKVVNREE